jgi:hypothetical protein
MAAIAPWISHRVGFRPPRKNLKVLVQRSESLHLVGGRLAVAQGLVPLVIMASPLDPHHNGHKALGYGTVRLPNWVKTFAQLC